MNQLVYNWWTVLLRGVLAIFMGLIAFFFPGITLVVLIGLFAAYSLLEGVLLMVSGFRFRKETGRRWWILVLTGFTSLAVGVVALAAPLATAIALLYLIAAWAIATGILEIVAALRLRKEIKGEWVFILHGVLTILFGGVLILIPEVIGFLTLIWMTGVFWFTDGILLMILAFRLRNAEKYSERTIATL